MTLQEIPSGAGVPATSATVPRWHEGETGNPLSASYTEMEFQLAGTARTYAGTAIGPARPFSTGHRYVTRLLARHPTDPARFSGRVLVEPFNTTYGLDHDPLWLRVGDLLQDNGDAWVGVSERASSTVELKRHDAARYAAVHIGSNDLAWDILRSVGTGLKAGGDSSPLSHLRVQHVYLGGYSQSGLDTATFAMAFGAVYDGYFPAARAASLTPLSSDIAAPRFVHAPIGPVGVPVIDVEPQSDVEGFAFEGFVNPGGASVRRDDSDAPGDRFRLYELPGAPHVAMIEGCEGGGSSFPTPAFLRAALLWLFRWAEQGVAPPPAARIDLADGGAVAVAAVDRFGNAVGGVRSPFLDVPLARYDVHCTPGPLCKLAGREVVLPVDVLTAVYGDVQRYLDEFIASLDAAIEAGYLLEQDRAAILADHAAKAHLAFAAVVARK